MNHFIEPDERPEVATARRLANALNEPVYIVDSPGHKNAIVPADHFRPANMAGAKIRAVGFPAGWSYQPGQRVRP